MKKSTLYTKQKNKYTGGICISLVCLVIFSSFFFLINNHRRRQHRANCIASCCLRDEYLTEISLDIHTYNIYICFISLKK